MRGLLFSFIVFCALPYSYVAQANADVTHGEALYQQCRSCHQPDRNSIGPKHCDLIDRKAGSVPNYNYSSAMKNSGITWTADALDKFLDHPSATVPNNYMPFAGVHNAHDRTDLIAYLITLKCP